jgi:hypothetical protein
MHARPIGASSISMQCPRPVRAGFAIPGRQIQRLGMMYFTEPPSVPSDHLAPFTDQLRLAVAAYLARFTGSSPVSTPRPTCAATSPGAHNVA